jgi:hypothetical protein
MSVHAYHPETGASVVVTEEALAHMRVSGWMTQAEWEEQQAAAAAQEAAAQQAAPAASVKTAAKEK